MTEKQLRQFTNPFYWLVESEIGLSILPIYKAIIVILSGYGSYVSKNDVRWGGKWTKNYLSPL